MFRSGRSCRIGIGRCRCRRRRRSLVDEWILTCHDELGVNWLCLRSSFYLLPLRMNSKTLLERRERAQSTKEEINLAYQSQPKPITAKSSSSGSLSSKRSQREREREKQTRLQKRDRLHRMLHRSIAGSICCKSFSRSTLGNLNLSNHSNLNPIRNVNRSQFHSSSIRFQSTIHAESSRQAKKKSILPKLILSTSLGLVLFFTFDHYANHRIVQRNLYTILTGAVIAADFK